MSDGVTNPITFRLFNPPWTFEPRRDAGLVAMPETLRRGACPVALRVTPITPMLAFRTGDGQINYFNGNMPVFVHDQGDIATFRMITAQFCVNGNTQHSEIEKAFGIPLVTVKRAVKLYRQEGPKGSSNMPANTTTWIGWWTMALNRLLRRDESRRPH